MSALYQYHNAPEVAPAHGLEYDDTVYPHSDKYPVVRDTPSYDPSNYKGKHAFPIDNRPPRIIFGMKVRTFLLVALVMALVVIGAAVGGAIGGKSVRDDDGTSTTVVSTSASATTATATSTSLSSYSAATPTYTPSSGCTNDTTYDSSYASSSTSSDTGLVFTAYCDLTNPLITSSSKASNITEAYVYSFSDCIEICASYNYINGGSNCTVAAYRSSKSRPVNCWIGHTEGTVASSLSEQEGTDVALVQSSSS